MWISKRTNLKKTEEGIVAIYWIPKTVVEIHSRRNHIPHANGVGFWTNNTFHVMVDGEELKAFHTLKDAKEYAEKLNR